MSSSRRWLGLLLVMVAAAVMVLSSTLAIGEGLGGSGSAPSANPIGSAAGHLGASAPPASPVAPTVPASPAISTSRAALVDRARQAFIDNGVSLNDFLPPTLNAAPGPVTTTQDHIVPLYDYAAAPIGISTFGLENVTGTTVPYVLNTTSLEGTFYTGDPLGLQVLSPYYGTLQAYGDQMNTVLNNTTIFGHNGYDFWLQNVIQYTTSSNSLELLNNIWNFSSPSGTFPSSSILHGQGRVEESEVYETSGPTITVSYPFTLKLWLNTTVGSYAGSPLVNEVYFNYTVLNKTGVRVCPATEPSGDVCGEYDNVYFNSKVNVAAGSAEIQANGKQYTPLGLPSDMEMDVGIGQSDGANANVVYANATVGLYVYNSTTDSYVAPPSTYDFGSETGETGIGAYTTWNTVGGQPVAYLRTGPSLLTGLWNVTGGTDGAPSIGHEAAGAYALNYAGVAPGNAFIAIAQGASPANQSFFQVAPTFGWYTGKGRIGQNIWLSPGTYSVEVMLSGYVQSNQTVTLSANQSLSVTLVPQANPTVYTPLWAYSASDLANLSTSGGGTAGNPYVLVGTQTASLAPVFAVLNDYLFIVYSGIWINATSAYFEFNPAPSLEVTEPSWWYFQTNGLAAAYGATPTENQLPMYFYHASNFVVEHSASIGLWSSDIEVGHDYAVYCNVCSDSLFAANYFNVSSEGLDLLGAGTAQHNWVWGNTFGPYSNAAYPGVSAPSTGLAITEAGDHVYNNAFYTNHTLTSTSTSNVNYYNATGGYQPASNSVTVLGVALTGSVLGLPVQGGNYYRDYGALPDPYGVLPYVGRASTPTGTAEIGKGGDSAPIATLPGDCAVCEEGQGLYHLTFTESGLKSGASWTMKIEGVPVYEPLFATTYTTSPTNTSTTTTSGFWLPNGTYTWVVSTSPSGYAAITQTGSLTVNGTTVGISVSFGTSYTQTVSETGLPTGTVWWFNVTGRSGVSGTVSASTKTITDPLPNGSYSYAIGGVPHYAISSGAATGIDTIAGATPATLSVTFAPAYTVTFTESGLPAMTTWYLNLSGGGAYSSTGTTIAVGEFNGTYDYAPASANKAYSAASGVVVVHGASALVAVPFAELFVTPSATPNPTQVGGPIVVSAGARGGSGTYTSYAWAGVPAACGSVGNVASFDCTPTSSGVSAISVTVTDSNGSVVTGSFNLTVEPTLTAMLSASPSTTQVGGTSVLTLAFAGGVAPIAWTLQLGGVAGNLSGVVGDSYAFAPATPGTYTFYLNASDAVGSLSNTTATVTVEPALAATLAANLSSIDVGQTAGLALGFSGGVAPVTWTLGVSGGGGNLSGVVGDVYDFAPAVAGNYTFYLNATDAVGSPATAVATVTVDPALSAGTAFADPNPVYETGPTLIATTGASGGTGPGTYSYAWSGLPAGCGSSAPYFECSPTMPGDYAVTLTVTDANGATAVSSFVLQVGSLYLVSINETGLPVGTSWSVDVRSGGGSQVVSGDGSSIQFAIANGSYTYTVASANSSWAAMGGAFDVAGAGVSVAVAFSEVTSAVTYTESGLSAHQLLHKGWAVALDGDRKFSTTASIVFSGVVNGSYPVLVTGPSGMVSTVSGTQLVAGTTNVPVVFQPGHTVTLSFGESGLPRGASWCVAVDGLGSCATTGGQHFANLTPGSYSYALRSPTVGQTISAKIGPSAVPTSGTVDVLASEKIAYKFAYDYAVTVSETGLASGSWSVTLHGATQTAAAGSPIVFEETNGSYGVRVVAVAGYTSSASPHTVVVRGTATSVAVTFTPRHGSVAALPAGSLRESTVARPARAAPAGWAGIAVLAGLLACLGATIVRRRPTEVGSG